MQGARCGSALRAGYVRGLAPALESIAFLSRFSRAIRSCSSFFFAARSAAAALRISCTSESRAFASFPLPDALIFACATHGAWTQVVHLVEKVHGVGVHHMCEV